MIQRIGQVLARQSDPSAPGIPVPGATIYVYDINGNYATLTSDGVTALTQPLTTDEFGNYSYYADVGYYREDTWFGGKLRSQDNNIAIGSPGADLNLRTDLAPSAGAGLVGFSAGGSYSAGTIGKWLQDYGNKSSSTHSFLWGSTSGAPAWDGVSDFQAFFTQTQPTYLPDGSLGAQFAQRIASYTGGAVSDATAPVTGAARSYTQIAATVGRAVEAGGLSVCDNLSYLAQGVGHTSQANSVHGGRVWGKVNEAHELPESFTATAGQTVFAVPNGFNSVAAVTKNGTLLTVTTDYTLASPNVMLTSGATVGDIINVHRGDPQNGMIGVETDVFAGPGTDTANPISGNRIGHSIFGYRQDKTINVAGHIGTLLSIVSDPSDTTYLTVDRGVLFQGKFATGIDFTASNFTAVNWLIKFSSAGGVDNTGNLLLDTGKVLKVGGSQVVAARSTGWSADTGTAKKTANATYAAGTTLTYSASYVQAEQTAMATRVAAIETALQNLAQKQKAITDALIAHGLIGT